MSAVTLENLGPPETFSPIRQGPVWEVDDEGMFLLPEHTLGWAVIAFCAEEMLGADGELGWQFTLEQARFILWFYAIDDRGRWIYRDAVMQKVKGWGKDPMAAVIALVELVGPCRFGGWAADGTPIAIRQKNEPWIQIAATTFDQTKNTMLFLQGLIPDAMKKKYQMEVNKNIIYAFGGAGLIEAISSSNRSKEGNRVSLVIGNEPQHWVKSNDGHTLYAVLRRNVNKMRKKKGSRLLLISNAYNPAEDSVMQRVREGYEKERDGGQGVMTLYDSLEAPENVPLFPQYTRLDENGDRIVERDEHGNIVPPDRETLTAHLELILRTLGGDATWLDPEETANEILRPDADLSEMRRFYLNSVVSGDEVFVTDGDLTATVDPMCAALRAGYLGDDITRLVWPLIGPKDPIVMFFDGSKSDDSTALVGCRLSDGLIFVIGAWEKPPESRGGKTWLAPREQIDSRVHEAFATFNVVAFWADPSHAKDDQTGSRYWDTLIDGWHQKYGDRLQLHAMLSGDRRSSVMWDMTNPSHQQTFCDAVVRFGDEMDLQTVRWDGHPLLRAHFRHSRKAWTPFGPAIRKPARGDARKIDLAVCAVGAWMLRRLMLNKGLEEAPQGRGFLVPESFRTSRRSW